MSLNSVRTDIKAALDAVAGVAGFVKRPSTPKAGDAWPIWRGGERDADTGLFSHGWAIGVATPQDEQAANDWIDSHVDDLVRALRPVAYVESYVPANFGSDTSPVFGLLITVSRE